jgi:hypothetical protein
MRRLVLLGIGVVLMVATLLRGRLVLRRVEMVYWQHRCMTYVPPPEQAAFDARGAPATPPPGNLNTFSSTAGRVSIICCVPHAWDELSGLMRPGAPASASSKGTLFLGRLRSPAGHERLVAVDVVQYYHYAGCVDFSSRVFRPGSLLNEPVLCAPGIRDDMPMQVMPRLVFFTAKADPADPSRFSFVYSDDGDRVAVVGHLKDDDTIKFDESLEVPHTAPARGSRLTPPAPASPGLSR